MMTSAPEVPLTEQTFFILLSLASSPRHGYAILKDVGDLSDGRIRLSISTLYTSLKRLLEQGWIERDNPDEPDESGRPRKEYRLTPTGWRFLHAETARLQGLVRAAQDRLPQDTQ
jgi:DNA-binding PadR family transcriptional regulator